MCFRSLIFDTLHQWPNQRNRAPSLEIKTDCDSYDRRYKVLASTFVLHRSFLVNPPLIQQIAGV